MTAETNRQWLSESDLKIGYNVERCCCGWDESHSCSSNHGDAACWPHLDSVSTLTARRWM